MDSATAPTYLRIDGTPYAVERHNRLTYLVGPRGGQHLLVEKLGTLRSDGFPGVRFALDLSSATKRGAVVELESASCSICGELGDDGHNHTDAVLCNLHASQWYAGVSTTPNDAWRTRDEAGPSLRQHAHDEIIATMRAAYASLRGAA